jgi:hypothetical protein
VKARASAKVTDAIECLRSMVHPFRQPQTENDTPFLPLPGELAVTPEHDFPVEILHDPVERQT